MLLLPNFRKEEIQLLVELELETQDFYSLSCPFYLFNLQV